MHVILLRIGPDCIINVFLNTIESNITQLDINLISLKHRDDIHETH